MGSEVGMVARRYQNKFSWIAQKQDKSSNLNAIETYSNCKMLKLKKKYRNEHAVSKNIYKRHYLVSFKVCNDAKYQKIKNKNDNSVVVIMWYLSGFQLSHYTEGFCSASPLEEILAYTFSRYPIKSTTAAFIKRRRCAFILCFICYIMEYDSIFDFDGLIWKQFSRNYYISVSICVGASKWLCHSLSDRERDTSPVVCLWQWNWVSHLGSWNL